MGGDVNTPQQATPGIDTANLGAQDFSQGNTTADMSGGQQTADMSGGQQSPDMSANTNMGDEDENPFRGIQKITGKLTQKMRDNEQGMSDKQYKYIINSILSAIDPTKLSDGDKKSIMSKLNGQAQNSGMEQPQQNGGGMEELSEVDDDLMNTQPQEPEIEADKKPYYDLVNTPIIKSILSKAGLNPSHEDIYVLAVDVAEAIYVYTYDYNEDISLIHYLKGLLNKNNFKPRPSLNNYNNLDPDGKDIYLALVSHGEEPNEVMNENKKIIYKDMITEIKNKLRKK